MVLPRGVGLLNPWLERRVLHYAHRGGAREAPENTLAAFRHGLEAGAHGLEFDVRASADGALVVIHDATLDRVTDARGAVAELPVAEIREATVTCGPEPPTGRDDCRIPLLEEVLAEFPDAMLNLEIKATAPDVEPYETQLAELLRRHTRLDRVIVGSFHDEALRRFRSAAPDAWTSLGSGEVLSLWTGDWQPDDTRYAAVQVPIEYQGTTVVTEEFVEACHAAGLALHVWTVDDPASMRHLVALGVDGIMTDRPTLLRRVLDESGTAWT